VLLWASEVNIKVRFPLALAFEYPEPGTHQGSVADILAYVSEIVRRAEGIYATTAVT
jgi:hypothetical protein